ncbi:hypothetical protein EKO23_20055 [Nocardioides guangzhouensis]|uniref:Uncharacterized protein n=1 Tax=Nocardioides guangzhouensis TaxID=2497878 RepID=A0A4Q4Z6N7_9ACTN|nr:hypothetical protein [Nocardioides guangzhouensis]RYP83138.1 hypothetical protein EKO23_20055 [Nocardioides guangzhouensis]
MNSRRLRIGAATAISVVAASLAATTAPASAADCFTVDPAPTITGLVRVGDDLTAHRGTWAPAPSSLVVTWYVGGVIVEGNPDDGGEPYHGLTYSPEASDAGKTVVIKVTGTRSGCSPAQTVASAPTIPVHPASYDTGPIPNPPKAAVPTGDFTVGKTVTASPDGWPAGATVEQYRWYVESGTGLVLMATTAGPKLKLPGDTYGREIAVQSVATLDYSKETRSQVSDASPTVAIGTLTGTRPTISGIRKVGRKLTAVRGTWTAGTTFAYRWYANGHAIKGATARTFTPKAGHAGRRISVKVTGRQTGYRTLALTSAQTRPIAR